MLSEAALLIPGTPDDEMLSLVAGWAREHTYVSVMALARRFCVTTEEAQAMLAALQQEGTLGDVPEGDTYPVIVTEVDTAGPVYLAPPDAHLL